MKKTYRPKVRVRGDHDNKYKNRKLLLKLL